MRKITPSLLTLVSTMMVAGSTYAAGPQRIAIESDVTIYAVAATDNATNKGVYSIGATSGSATRISAPAAGSTVNPVQYYTKDAGGTFIDKDNVVGVYYNYSYYMFKANSAGNENGTWAHSFCNYRNPDTFVSFTYKMNARDMTYDATTQTIYGMSWNDTSGNDAVLSKYDFDNYTVTQIGATPGMMDPKITAIAADAEGQLWGVGGYVGKLYKIDKTNGQLTEVSTLGVQSYNKMQSAAIDTSTGKMYWGDGGSIGTFATTPTNIYEIDLTAASPVATKLCTLDNVYNCFYIAPPATKKGAPAAVEDLAGAFTGVGSKVKVTFTAPSLTFGGSDLTGELDYTLTLDGESLDQGKVEAGAAFEKEYDMADGTHDIAVVLSNAAGDGPKATASLFAGFDTPGNISALKAANGEGYEVVLTWEAPKGLNGGILDPSKLSYTITRNPGAVAVAENVTELTYTDAIPAAPIAEYTYTVTVNYGDATGESLTSGAVLVGDPYTVPYSQNFTGVTSLGDLCYKTIEAYDSRSKNWTVVEDGDNTYLANEDNVYFTGGDKLYIAPIKFYGGVEYTLKFKAAVKNGNDGKLDVVLATSRDGNADNYIEPYIFQALGLPKDQTELTEYEKTFTVEETGVYNICFIDGRSYADRSTMMLDDIEITGKFPTPVAVTDLLATAGGASNRDVTLTFTAPAVDIYGNDLTGLTEIQVFRGTEPIGSVTENLVPGQQATYVDEQAPRGFHSYKVVARVADFTSGAASAAVFAGYANNLVLKAVTAPASKVEIDGYTSIKVTVLNDAMDPALDYYVTLLCDGEPVLAQPGEYLSADEEIDYTFDILWTKDSPKSAIYGVIIDNPGDEYDADNTSEGFPVEFEQRSGVADGIADGVAVSAAARAITVTGARGLTVAVHSADGRLAARSEAHGETYTTDRLPAGVYVVAVGGRTFKVVL